MRTEYAGNKDSERKKRRESEVERTMRRRCTGYQHHRRTKGRPNRLPGCFSDLPLEKTLTEVPLNLTLSVRRTTSVRPSVRPPRPLPPFQSPGKGENGTSLDVRGIRPSSLKSRPQRRRLSVL